MTMKPTNGSVMEPAAVVAEFLAQPGSPVADVLVPGLFDQAASPVDDADEPRSAQWIGAREAEILIRTVRAIGGERTLAERCERVLDAVVEILATADVGLALVDPAGQALAVVAARGTALATDWKPSPFGDEKGRGIEVASLPLSDTESEAGAPTYGLPADPLAAFRESGYVHGAEKERTARNQGAVSSYA